ncbi:MAG TPA: hypothetical protein VE934_10865 [Polaromonas sp.]|uniref:hypothetical protein n=1 Tax=Polaromonas sp. TaxID=1869339 RepID=UPI002D4AE720|nr:hypothetical protein [Polaromonas sp.]HYW57455.1 hypothetical protein [Polaromonas sp.]
MFDYDGDLNASLDDYRELVAKVIQETFPKSRCAVRVRQTKAMRFPKLSISIDDGPPPKDVVDAIPLLAGGRAGVRWAHCGKVLPALGYSVRSRPRGALAQTSQEIWEQLDREMPGACFIASNGRLNPKFSAKHRQQVAARANQAHPAHSSATMALIERGVAGNIVGIAMNQRSADLGRATPMPGGGSEQGPRRSTGPKRL